MGMNSRYLEQKDFFIKAEFTFTSGTKQFKGEYVNINDELRYIFKGESQSMSFQDMLNKLTSEAALYDSLNFKLWITKMVFFLVIALFIAYN